MFFSCGVVFGIFGEKLWKAYHRELRQSAKYGEAIYQSHQPKARTK
ncbi:hypothetical protein AND4_16130 [Vibrio sp. AND4]|nr:hypothetical protein AND4_16130 [Vibrio sp. AND4]